MTRIKSSKIVSLRTVIDKFGCDIFSTDETVLFFKKYEETYAEDRKLLT